MTRPSRRVASRTYESSKTMTVPSPFSSSIRLAGVALAAMLLLGACGKDAADDTKTAQQAVDPNLVVAQPTLVERLKVAPMRATHCSSNAICPGTRSSPTRRPPRSVTCRPARWNARSCSWLPT